MSGGCDPQCQVQGRNRQGSSGEALLLWGEMKRAFGDGPQKRVSDEKEKSH